MATATLSRPSVYAGETLRNVDWATYCKFRDDPANDHLRMMYLDGVLRLMSPHLAHDFNSRVFVFIVTTVARVCRIRSMAIGTTTLKKAARAPLLGSGKEPDEGFYLGENVARMRGKKELDLTIDPPPDLAIEIDNTANSETSLATYARIGVPEVWRFDVNERTLWFGRLDGDHYEEIARSLSLARLTPGLVLQALEAREEALDDTDWLDWLDAWARNLPEAN
jgi:Uma2 family endonuclease